MNKKFFILFFSCIMTLSFGQNQKLWSLEKCLKTGLKNDLGTKINKLEIIRAQKKRYPLWMSFLPTASANGNHHYSFGSTIDPATNSRVSSDVLYDGFSLDASVNLLDFKAFSSAKKDKTAIEIARANEQEVVYEYKLNLMESYFNALYSQELAAIQSNQLKNTALTLQRIKQEVTLGNKPKSDLYDIELSYAQEEKKLLETKQLLAFQKLQLFQLMNVKEEGPVILQNDNEGILVEGNTDFSRIKNPKITLARLKYKNSLADISLQKAKMYPSLSAYYSLSTFYSSPLRSSNEKVDNFNDQIDLNKNNLVGIRLKIPLFGGLKNHKEINTLKIESEKMQIESKQEELKIQQQIEQEKTKENQYTELNKKLKQTVLYAKKSYKTTRTKFLNNKIDALNYTNLKNQLLSAEYELLKNKFMRQYTALKIHLLETGALY